MNSLVKGIGEIVLTILIILVPMLAAFSYCSDWLDNIKFLLTVLTAADFVFVNTMINKMTRKSMH